MDKRSRYQARGVTRTFGATIALDGVDFEARAGEIHALVGENGAGKSTLVKILTGAVPPSAGDLSIDGAPIALRAPRDARRAGIAVVHQDNQLFAEMRVWENVAVTTAMSAGPLVKVRATRAMVASELERHAISIDVDARARELGPVERKVVEIARSLLHDPAYLFLDEPTAALTPAESERLMTLLFRLRDAGKAIVLVTHHLEEVMRVADRTTVLRNGRLAGVFDRNELSRDALVTAMVGDVEEQREPLRTGVTGDPVVELSDVRLAGQQEPFDLTVRKGEIVAIVGLLGSGTTELLAGLAGAQRIHASVRIAGRRVHLRSPAQALVAGIGYVPSDRKSAGVIPDQSVTINIALASLPQLGTAGFRRQTRMERLAEDTRRRLGIRCQNVGQPIRTLSGGNQQKALVGRWLVAGVPVLVIDEPTQGVDVGARAELHTHLRTFAREGGSIVFGSSDLDEVLVLADRIIVMRDGTIAAEVEHRQIDGLTRSRLLSLVTGIDQSAIGGDAA